MHDDPLILDRDWLLRRIPLKPSHIKIDEGKQTRRVTSGAFCFDDDGCSVYREGLLNDAGLDWHDICRSPGTAARMQAGNVRALGAGVVPDPQASEATVGFAHGLITTSAESRSQQEKLRKGLSGIAQLCW
ncbi:MAG: hypothetical protein Q8P38_04820 [Candidatus Nanopelagicales bacterium]|nr:hypothetical protein [Candidatus Nanopelagicales bacterium]